MTETHVGTVTHWFPRKRVVAVRLDAPVQLGDRLRVHGRLADFRLRVRSMQVDHEPVDRAAAGQEVGILVPKRARAGDEVLLVGAEERPWWRRLFAG